ncbi:prolipoprotein diacylglyceryl transferase [Candidatus Omnitrophota bacterium]
MHPELFEIGAFQLKTYGVFIALAFFIGYYLVYSEAKRKNFYPEKILDLELCVLISGIIGARILHVAVNLDYYRNHLLEIPMLWRGGLAIYGGLIFGIVASWVFMVKSKIPLRQTADLIIPYIALGQAIGRMGCFLNGCCYGRHTIPVLGVCFPGETVSRFPTQILASLALLAIFVILKLAQKKSPYSGFVFTLYLVLYSQQRFFIDFLRGDTPRYAFEFTVSQFISIGIFVIGVLLFVFGRKAWKN